jgi:glyoxylase-like metal-dependent hydrolase (beta-lactamase superfamily II)
MTAATLAFGLAPAAARARGATNSANAAKTPAAKAPAAADAADAKAVLEAAAASIGAAQLSSIQVAGRGAEYLFGQAYDGASPWPRFNVPKYTLSIDYTTSALRDERIRQQGQNPPLGGGNQPLVGEQRQVWALSGGRAWNVTGQNAAPAGRERDGRTAADGRQTQIWLTPHGFIKAALAAQPAATARTETIRGAKKTIIAFTATTPASTRVKLEGVIDARHLVERIETWVGSPVLGDTLFEAVFQDYQDFGGVQFPAHVTQREGGYPVLDLTITAVTPNAPVVIDVPPTIAQAKPPAPFVITPQQLSDGVWSIPLGPRDRSVAIEFTDYILVVEAPESEAISIPAIDAIKTLFPKKPIAYIVNTHTHFDHAGGLRTYAAEGAVVVTHAGNVPYFQQAWANPRTIDPDRLAKSGRAARFEGVTGSRTFSDGARQAVVYHYAGNLHNPGLLMVYLPKEKIVIEADSYNPPNNPDEPPNAVPNLVQWQEAVERLKLDIEQIVPVHGRLATYDEALKAIGAYKDQQLWPH